MAQFGTLAVKRNHGFRVSDGFCFGWFWGMFWQCSYLSDRSCGMPGFGTVEFGVVCDGLGKLLFFVLQ